MSNISACNTTPIALRNIQIATPVPQTPHNTPHTTPIARANTTTPNQPIPFVMPSAPKKIQNYIRTLDITPSKNI